MSILTGFKKVKNYILTSSGYQLLSRWTSSQTVEFDDGKTAQAKLGEINGIAKTYVDMKKATDNSMAVSAKAVMEGLENSSALISMTQAEYDALSDEEKTDNNMRAILDANPDVVDAKNVNFDNTNTNLIATNTQSAITELNGKLHNMLIPLNEQQKNHTINFTDYDVLKIQFKDQSINNALFSREYLRPASKQMMDSICLYNGTAVHELFFTVSFDPSLKYVYVSDAYICRVDVIDSTVTSVTAPIIQAVFGMQCVN